VQVASAPASPVSLAPLREVIRQTRAANRTFVARALRLGVRCEACNRP
jgi:hypothetical protein